MKKLLIGCGILFLVAIVCSVGCGAWVFYKINQLGQGFQQAQFALAEVNNEYAFEAPDPGTPMREERFESYITVREQTHERVMGVPLINKLMTAAEQQNANPSGTAPPPDIGVGEVFGAIWEFPKVLQDFALYLDAAEMSADEFSWHSVSVIEAISEGKEQGDPQMSALWDQIMFDVGQAQTALDQQQGNPQLRNIDLDSTVAAAEGAEVPPENIEMVKDHLEEFSEGSFLLVFEMLILQIMDQAVTQGQYPAAPAAAGFGAQQMQGS